MVEQCHLVCVVVMHPSRDTHSHLLYGQEEFNILSLIFEVCRGGSDGWEVSLNPPPPRQYSVSSPTSPVLSTLPPPPPSNQAVSFSLANPPRSNYLPLGNSWPVQSMHGSSLPFKPSISPRLSCASCGLVRPEPRITLQKVIIDLEVVWPETK